MLLPGPTLGARALKLRIQYPGAIYHVCGHVFSGRFKAPLVDHPRSVKYMAEPKKANSYQYQLVGDGHKLFLIELRLPLVEERDDFVEFGRRAEEHLLHPRIVVAQRF